jgi:hypothetical protein
MCAMADTIVIVRVEKVDRKKKGIVYSKIRDLKVGAWGSVPTPTFTHVLSGSPNLVRHRQDIDGHDQQNEAILAWAEEGKTAVLFRAAGHGAICLGHCWYSFSGDPPAKVLAGGGDSRFTRLYCGDAEGLVAAVTNLLAGKEVTVPRMVGTATMLSDRTAPVRRMRTDRPAREGNDSYNPFHGQAPWSTNRGNPQHTGADDSPGPTKPNVLWAYKSKYHFLAPLVPGARELYASSLGAFNAPGFHAFALDPAADKQLRGRRASLCCGNPSQGHRH